MAALAIKILTGWSTMAVIVSLCAAAAIRIEERLHKEEVLTALFVAVSNLQSRR